MPRLLLAIGLVSLVLIGCGGSDDGDSSSGTPSASDSIAKADQICTNAQTDRQKLVDSSDMNSMNPKVLAKYLKASFAGTKKTNDQLKNLTPPAGSEAEWKAWIASLDVQASATQSLVASVKPGMGSGANSAYVKALNAATSQQVKTNKLATDADLKVCSQSTPV